MAYHYPPDVLELMVDGLSKLYKSKPALVTFFRGAGVSPRVLGDLPQRISARDSPRKVEIVREVLTRLNDDGDASLAARREVIKRIVEHEDFTSAWPADVAGAKAFVADLRKLQRTKDALTKIEDARRSERHARMAASDKAALEVARRRSAYIHLRDELFGLFAETDAQRRGLAAEPIMNKLFQLHDMQVREAFRVRGPGTSGVIEQIDGAVVVDGQLCLVELKWWNSPLGVEVVAQHFVRVASRDGAIGIVVSAAGFTSAAVQQTRDALALRTFVLVSLQEIVEVLTQDRCLREFFRRRVQGTILEKSPCCVVDVHSLPRFA